jgi:RNA polymerase sigma-70 factor (ECF subfamily)
MEIRGASLYGPSVIAWYRKFDGNVHWLCGTWDYVRDRPRIQDMHKDSRIADDDNVIAQLGPLRRYAQSLTRDVAQAEDLVHDTLLRAYEHRSAFRTGGNMRSWLLSILHNTFIDTRRKRGAEMRRDTEAAQLNEGMVSASQESTVYLEQIRKAFLGLSEEQRSVLHLVAIEGLSYQDAAETLSIPIGTLMSRLGRARASLREFEESNSAVPAVPAPRHLNRPSLRVVGGNHD